MSIYRLTNKKKQEIADNLVAIAQSKEEPTVDTVQYINEWLVVGKPNKKPFVDVWNIVLNQYQPQAKRLLFRACCKQDRLIEGKIASYSGCFVSMYKWKREKIIILDTEVAAEMKTKDIHDGGFSFYPLVEIMEKYNIGAYYLPENEYIVRQTWNGVSIFEETFE